MRSRLTFPSAGMEDKFVWDRYNLHNNGVHKWNKYNTETAYTYFWDKYALSEGKKQYHWDKYTIQYNNMYKWDRYPVSTTSEPVWNQWLLSNDEYDNINLVFENEYELDTFDSERRQTGYLVLYGVDDEGNYYNKVLNVSELLTNDITLYEIVYSQIWFGASFADSLSSINYDDPEFLGYCNIYKTQIAGQNEYYLQIMGYSITSGNFAYAYRGEPVSNIQYQTTHNYRKRKKLLQQTSIAPNGDETDQFYGNLSAKDASGQTIKVTQELQNSKYTTIENTNIGYLVDFDNCQVITSTNPSSYPNGLVLGPNFDSSDYYYEAQGLQQIASQGSFIEHLTSEDETAYPDNGELDGYWYVKNTNISSYYYWDKYELITTDAKYKYKRYNVYPYRWLSTPITTQLYLNYTASEPITFTVFDAIISLYNGDDDIPTWRNIRLFKKDMSYVDMNGKEFYDTYKNLNLLLYSDFIGVTVLDTNYGLDKPLYYFTSKTKVVVRWLYPSGNPIYCIRDGFACAFNILDGGQVNLPNNEGFENYHNASIWGVTSSSHGIGSFTPIPDGNVPDMDPSVVEIKYGYTSDYPDGGYQDNYFYILDNSYENDEVDFSSYTIMTPETPIYPDKGFSEDKRYYYEYIDYSISQSKGKLLGGVISENIDDYPDDGVLNNYYYVKRYADVIYSWGKYDSQNGNRLETVYSNNLSFFPSNGEQNGYWYVRENDLSAEVIVEKTDFIEQVNSNSYIYPTDGIQGDYWYVFSHLDTETEIKELVSVLEDESKNTYPYNGLKGDYWYEYIGFENNGPYKSRWVDEVESNQNDAYPSDGIQGNYWYIYKKSYEGCRLQISDSQLRGGINYKHNINPDEDYTIGCVASAEISFSYDNSNNDFEQYANNEYCDYYTWQPEDKDWRLIGRFYLDNVKHKRNLVDCVAFDIIGTKAEEYVDDFVASTNYPISITTFFYNLCQYLGITGSIDYRVVNKNYVFEDNFEAINITARQLYQYIAEVCGAHIQAMPNNTIKLTPYNEKSFNLTNSHYTKATVANYRTSTLDGLIVKANTDDLGVSSGDTEGNLYVIENNPLFYADNTNAIQTEVSNIFVAIQNISYTPAEVELLQDFGINCGDIITLNGNTFYVMEKELSASGCKFKCLGNKVRAKQASTINSDIIALRGKTNELYRDLETTKSTLTDATNGLQSQIIQTAEEINSRVTNDIKGLESKISQTAGSFSTSIEDAKKELQSSITQTVDSIRSEITEQGKTITSIQQDLDGISLTYNSTNGTASITIGDITVSNLVDGEYVESVVAGIEMDGYVKFNDLSSAGSTTINGSNITTGTISADRINMTGSISWGDLTQSCKNTIASYAGGDIDIPDYIHSTYIDEVRIQSPEIYGGTIHGTVIYAGDTDECYCRMSENGFRIYSDWGSNLCNIGWYASGSYRYPYIILGAGADSAGTNMGMVKKYSTGIWIGDSDNADSANPGGTGIFIDFNENKFYKYVNGTKTAF